MLTVALSPFPFFFFLSKQTCLVFRNALLSLSVSLQSYNGQRFLSAKVTLENDQGGKSSYEDLGRFNIVDSVATRYSTDCINMIETTNTNPKKRLDVEWIAPSTVGMGCILIRATVLQHRDVWFMDDGGLTKRICEEVIDDLESQKKDLEERLCCACDEARYEVSVITIGDMNEIVGNVIFFADNF